jgi:arylsulfatase A-like enzyme
MIGDPLTADDVGRKAVDEKLLRPRGWDGALAGRSVLALALWFGLVAGFAELACILAATYGAGIFLSFWGWHRLWMTPAADALLFLLPGLLLALLVRFAPRRISLRLCVTIFAFLAALSLAVFFDRKIHRAALLIFSAGVGIQAGRLALKHHAGFQKLVKRTLPALAAVVVMLGVGLVGWQRFAERRALRNLPVASGETPNVLLLILDTVRSLELSLHGYERATSPQLDRFASRGVTFDWAMSTAPWTLPSHASMFTGRYPFETNAYFRTALDDRFPTLAEALREHGYATAGFVANTEYTGRATGLARGFIRYEDYEPSAGYLATSSAILRTLSWSRTLRKVLGYYELLGRKDGHTINSAFLKWQGKNTGRPFFAFLNYFDAHAPYLPPAPFDTLFGGTKNRHFLVQQERYVKTSSPELKPHIPTELTAYDQSIAALDAQLGQLFAELERRGLLRNTVVLVTSDHGEEFGEHGILGHAYNLNTTLLHVPLVVVAPNGVPVGQRIRTPVSLRDLPATILDLAGVPNAKGIPGKSLTTNWRGAADTAGMVVSSEGSMVSLVADRYHYIRSSEGQEQVFDFLTDRSEQHDLAATEAGKQMLPAFRAALPKFYAEGQSWSTK